jgi:hypothetical protein
MNDGNRFRQPVSNLEPVNPTQASRMMSDHMHHNFRPSEELPISDEQPEPAMPASLPYGAPRQAAPKRSLKDKLKSLSKKQWAIIAVVAILLLGGGGVGAYALFFKKEPAAVAPPKVNKPAAVVEQKPTTVANTLSGRQVDPTINSRPVVGVMIENSTDARPQSGLNDAGVIFEAVAEGGITRFLALFQDKNPSYLGPVRSVRPYYIQWAMGFDAGITHVGGSPEALQDMKDWKAKDLDQFTNGSYFRRVTNRVAPHNVYTSMDQLFDLSNKKGFSSSTFSGFPRKDPVPSKTPTAKAIDLKISSSAFNVHYDYEAASNKYLRSEGGAAHNVVDTSGATLRLEPEVVVALVMAQGISADGVHTTYASLGSGHAYIFQDGTVVEGAWKKNTQNEQLTIVDAAGAPIKLNPGQTWLTAVAGNDRVLSTP